MGIINPIKTANAGFVEAKQTNSYNTNYNINSNKMVTSVHVDPKPTRSNLCNLFNEEAQRNVQKVPIKVRVNDLGMKIHFETVDDVENKKLEVPKKEDVSYEANENGEVNLYVCKCVGNRINFEKVNPNDDIEVVTGNHKVVFIKGNAEDSDVVYEANYELPGFKMSKYVRELFASTRRTAARNSDALENDDSVYKLSFNESQIIYTDVINSKSTRNELGWFYTKKGNSYTLGTTVRTANNNNRSTNYGSDTSNYSRGNNNMVGNRGGRQNIQSYRAGAEQRQSNYKGNNYIPWEVRKNWAQTRAGTSRNQ
jgi:hypothetical protein